MKKLLPYTLYPVLVTWPLVVMLAGLSLIHMPADPMARKAIEVALFLICAIPVIAALILLEKRMPWWVDREPSKLDVRVDLTHLALCWFAISPLAQALMRFLALGYLGLFASNFGADVWPTHWPLFLQFLLALVLGEFGNYWFHRLGHETTIGWKLHSTHHGTPQVYWLNSTRFHPIEVVVRTMFQTLPLVALGCNADTFLIYGAFCSIHGWVQHSNVAYNTRFFDLFMATSANHRWHHSTDVNEANHNYGLQVALWDRIFGTYYSPRDKPYFNGVVGIGDMPDFPKTYWGQTMAPFRWADLPRTQPEQSAEGLSDEEAV